MIALGLVLMALVVLMFWWPGFATGILLTYRIAMMLCAALLKVALGGTLIFFGLRDMRDENGVREVLGAVGILWGCVMILSSLGAFGGIAPVKYSSGTTTAAREVLRRPSMIGKR
jgi:hypothetical protein